MLARWLNKPVFDRAKTSMSEVAQLRLHAAAGTLSAADVEEVARYFR